VLRNPLAIWLFRWMHPDFATWVALRTSHTSRNMRPRDRGEGLKRVALARLAAEPALQLYVYGHTHAPALEKVAGGGVYANPGAWMDEPTFLRITTDRVELARLDGSAVRVLQHVERSASGN
jgi:UDP-2,3-diacylglucosamine hydrolase